MSNDIIFNKDETNKTDIDDVNPALQELLDGTRRTVDLADANMLIDALRKNHTTNVMSCAIQVRGLSGNTLLMYACASGAHDVAELLIKSGCDVDAVNAYGRNAVHVCAQAGHVDCLQLLINKNAKINKVDVDQCNPLHLAVKNSHYDVCLALLEKVPSMVDSPDCTGRSPLMLSCSKRDNEIMKLCIQYTTIINAVDSIGQNCLHYACKSNNSQGVKALLELKANVFQLNHQGLSPFHIASSSGSVEVLKQLMEYAVSSVVNKSEEVTSKMAEVCRQNDGKGWTLLHYACANGNKEVVEYLLSIGADVKVVDSYGYCPHCVAVFCGKKPLYSLLKPCNSGYITDMSAKSSTPSMNMLNEVKPAPLELEKSEENVTNKSTTTQTNECVIRFQMQCDRTQGHDVCIVGSCETLGEWNVEKSVRMTPITKAATAAAIDTIVTAQTSPISLVKIEKTAGTCWACDVVVPKNTTIKYRYILRPSQSQSPSSKWEEISGDRGLTTAESAIVDDGVFEKAVVNSNSALTKVIDNAEERKDALFSSGGLWSSTVWMGNEARLYLRLGHPTQPKKRNVCVTMRDNIEISKIVIKSGFTKASHFQGACVHIALPVSDPFSEWKFQAKKQHIRSLCTLQFDFYPKTGPAVARGYVSYDQLVNTSCGALTVPLHGIGGISDRCVGKFYLEYLLARPFSHPKCGTVLNRSFPKEQVLIGHRGTGSWKSFFRPGQRRTHIKENTILAFNTALSFGAQYVEFDVQLTRDKIPVIYHDFLFRTKDFTIPVHNIFLKQLKHYNESLGKARKALHESQNGKKEIPKSEVLERQNLLPSLKSSFSFGSPRTKETAENKNNDLDDLADGDNEKVDMLKHGMEGLDWLKDDYCTLAEAFELVPPSVGFNVEIKYPNHNEILEDNIRLIDMNEYLDQILEVVFTYAQNRKIMFSCFHPDICTLLMAKQPQYPVFFLTTASSEYIDPRTASLYDAVRFAKRNHLFGIVSAAGPVLEAPHLANSIHDSALLLLTYGDANNDTTSVDVQRRHGVDGIIVDHVQHVQSHIQTNPIKQTSK